jgi:hypothetical protein
MKSGELEIFGNAARRKLPNARCARIVMDGVMLPLLLDVAGDNEHMDII